MTMDRKVLQYLAALNAKADEALKGSENDIGPIVDDLSSFCSQLVSDQDLSLASAAVFDRESGLFSTVDRLRISRERTVHKAREKCLLFLGDFVRVIGPERAPLYSSFIKDNALRILRIDETKSVQAAALSPLISLFEIGVLQEGKSSVTMDWKTAEVLLAEFRKAKTSGSLKSNILITLGYSIEFFPSLFDEDHVNTVTRLCLNTLEEQLKQSGRDVTFILIAGAVKCLDSLLQWFDDTVPACGTVENAKRAYAYLEQVIYYREDMKRYEMIRAGLRLLTRHAWRFRLALFKNSGDILSWLQIYCTHSNASLRSAALPAYDQFISQISSCLISDDRRIEDPAKTYKMLMKQMLGILETRLESPKLVSLAIRAIGKLSGAIIKYSGKNDLEKAFQRLVPFVGSYSRGGDSHEELAYAVTVVGAFANIVVYVDRVEDFMISMITEVTGRIFYQFPVLFAKQKPAVYSTISSLFRALYPKENIFAIFLMNVVWSSLERATEFDISEPGGPLWKSYAELWCQLLSFISQSHPDFPSNEDSSEIVGLDVSVGNLNVSELRTLVFDSLIRAIMKLLGELNLKYRVKAPVKESTAEIPEQAMEPEADALIEPLDKNQMLKFLNLVEFILWLLSSDHASLMVKWIFPFSRCLISLSRKYPLISGYYKLLAAVIRIGDREDYFGKDESMNSHILIQQFLLEVVISSRRYKLELLASCLQLCLSCPPTLLDLPAVVGPLKRALKIGLRFFPLANVALDALQKWHSSYPKKLQEHLPDIVPLLGDYLFENGDSRAKSLDAKVLKIIKEEKTKIVDFEAVQLGVQRFIGQIGAFNHFLVPDVSELLSGTGGLAWDTVERVKFTVPLRDQKLDVWLDCMLPRLVELALSSSDRTIKVVSSELLHAVCLLMLGNAAKGPVRTKNEDTYSANYEKLYKRLFPSIFQLATDVEPVTQQLFSEFSMQLIHWMTNNMQKENPETMALLDAILEGLVDSDNGSLRELCSRCFGEFMRWSIRHAPLEASNFVNVTSMLRRLYNRMDHPNPYHRLGASMAVYQIYPVLRENSSIVDRHIFEITFFLVKSLRVGNADCEKTGTIKQASKALDVLQKLIVRNISDLQRPRKDRVLFRTLEDFMMWLLDQTRLPQEKCRSKCMGLLAAICTALSGGSPVHWFHEKFKPSERLEMLGNLFSNLPSNLFSAKELTDLSTAFHWFEWSLNSRMLRMDNLEHVKTPIFSTMEHFVEGLASTSVSMKIKDTAVLRLMSLIRSILQIGTGVAEPASSTFEGPSYLQCCREELLPIDHGKLQRLLCSLLFQPSELTSFAPESTEAEELRLLVSSVLWLLAQVFSDFKDGLVKVLQVMLDTSSQLDIGSIQLGQLTEDRLCGTLNLVKAYLHLHTLGVLVPTLGKERSEQISERLLLTIYNMSKESISPSLEPLLTEMLRLSFSLRVLIEQLLELVLDKTTQGGMGNTATTGGRFYSAFRKLIVQQVKFFYKKSLPMLLRESVRNDTARLLLHAVLDEFHSDKITRGSFMNEFLLHLKELRPCYLGGSSVTDKQYLAGIIHKLLLLDKESVIRMTQPSFEFIVEVVFSFLSTDHQGMPGESAVLRSSGLLIVPFFLEESVPGNVVSRLIDNLTLMVTTHLLVKEADLPKGSMERSSYLRTLNLLIGGIISSRNLNALEVLFPLLQNPTDLTITSVSEALKLSAQNIDGKRMAAYNFCLDVVRDPSKLPRLRKAVMDYFFVPLICSSPSDALTEWFSQHVGSLMDSLGRQIVSPDLDTEQELLLSKIHSYTLLELLYTQVPGPLIREKVTTHQQLLKAASNDSRGKNDPRVYLFQENISLWRDLHISAYTCLAAVIMCTQEQEKIFNVLFKDAGNPLWQHLIDCNKVYSAFPVQTSTFGEAHAIVKGIRAGMKSTKGPKTGFTMTLSSQYLVGMSMSQEPVVINSFVGEAGENSMNSTDGGEQDADSESKEANVVEFVALDKDDFDQHPCMGMVLRVIEHLHSKFGGSHQEMPDWMKSIHATLDNTSTHANIRLFLGKVVVKARKAFGPFSGSFFQPLANVILHDPQTTGGASFHYLLRDISITILQWEVKDPADRHTASRFINHLVAVAVHESSQVLKANVEIIKAFMDLWKERVSIDGRLILNYLQAGSRSSNTSEKQLAIQKSLGLQLFVAAISSSVSFSQALDRLGIAKEEIFDIILNNLKLKAKEVYSASAEVLGMALKDKLDTDMSAVESKFKQHFMATFKEGDYSKCLHVMDRLTVQFSEYVGFYIHLLIDLLPRLHGTSKSIALDILLRDPACVVSHFNMIISFVSKLLPHRDGKAQYKSLRLLAEVLKEPLDQSIIERIVSETCDAYGHYDSEECRLQFYQILMFLYETKKLPHDMRVNRFLLMGLCDVSNTVRERMQNFWDSQLPEKLLDRFSHILNEMHLPEVESHWTRFTNVLLLKLCKRSVDYERPIFNAPLSDCEFQEHRIDSSAVGATLPMTPLFSEIGSLRTSRDTQTQATDASASLAVVNHGRGGMIRATASYSPSMTTFGNIDESVHTPSTLDGSQNTAAVDPITKLKRRLYFTRDSRSDTLKNVLNATRKRKALHSAETLERANKVRIMRQYRTGELPDIEIKHEDIIGPMAALAEKDATFARLVLSMTFGAFWQEDGAAGVKSAIRNGFQGALDRSQNESTLVGSIQDLCLKDKETWIQPEVAGRASLKSQNFQSGILLLEKQILYGTKPMQNSTKRHKGNSGQITPDKAVKEEAWLELARLYKALGEDDYVLSLYLNHLTKHFISHQALQSQVRGDTDRALVLYDKAINQLTEGENVSKIEEELWYNQRLSCLADLTRWGEVMEDALLQVETESGGEYDLEKFWHPKLQDPYMGLFVKGSLKVPAHQSLLTSFLQSSMEDTLKREVLLQGFGTELATSAVFSDEIDRARYYVSECYKAFRRKWSVLHPLATAARRSEIALLQKTAEIEEFIEFSSRPDWSKLPRLFDEWRERWPSSEKDDVEAWDDILQNRMLFFQKLQAQFNKEADTRSKENFTRQLDLQRASGFYEASRGVMKQGAYSVAQRYMNEYMAVNQRIADKGNFDAIFFKRLVKLRCLQALRASESEPENAVPMLEQVLDYVRNTAKKPSISNADDRRRILMLLEGDVSAQLGHAKLQLLLDRDLDIAALNQSMSLLSSAYKTYAELVHNAHGVRSHDMARMSFKFACFCDEVLSNSEDSKWNNDVRSHIQGSISSFGLPGNSALREVIVANLLRTLSLDSSIRPQHAVARILCLVGQHEETQAVFETEIERVPSWIFVGWLPQLLALMDKKEGHLFIGILESIAEQFPQALYFPFHVSKDQYGSLGLNRTEKLALKLKNHLFEGFIRALEDLTFPEKRLFDGLCEVKSYLIAGEPEKAQETFRRVYRDCLDVEAMRDANRQAGEYNVKFANDYAKPVLKALGEDGSKLQRMDEKKFTTAINGIVTNLQKVMRDLPVGKLSLASFSKWMASFDQPRGSRSSHEVIEIPGQYDGFHFPDVSSHVTLVGFDETLVGLSSKQRPKILTMRGSDEREYKFIVKGGEDLRLDQRIEQLFMVMNSVLKEDASCAQRQLLMKTYAVVPVSQQCGLLQFVENTCVLDDVIKEGVSHLQSSSAEQGKKTRNKATDLLMELRGQYQQWVEKKGGSKNMHECYKNLYTKVKPEELEQRMNHLVSQVPWDALKTGLYKRTTSAESFLSMRSEFARSLSVLSICGYIAGVGDRHLANTLVDMRSGSLVSIDFGYSFGTGVILLPVPELIPFRLTPQLTNLLLPLDSLGLLKNDMVRTMSALHRGRQVIAAVMDVFVREPLVDWKKEASRTASIKHAAGAGAGKDRQKQKQKQNEDVDNNDEEQPGEGSQEGVLSSHEQQHVELKIENARRKLELWNPAEVTIGELQSSVHADSPWLPAIEAAVRGDPARNARSRVKRKVCSSVEEQVECLIDQAMDPTLLGRLWVGWQSWM